MGLFDTVKEAVTTRQAAEHYGLKVDRSGKTCCIFHDDRHPSMKVDERFHCFSCGADGDVIDFTARLFDMSLPEAARKLAADFGLSSERTAYSSVKPKAGNSLLKRLKTYQNENYRPLQLLSPAAAMGRAVRAGYGGRGMAPTLY